jgi:hypothetical protein
MKSTSSVRIIKLISPQSAKPIPKALPEVETTFINNFPEQDKTYVPKHLKNSYATPVQLPKTKPRIRRYPNDSPDSPSTQRSERKHSYNVIYRMQGQPDKITTYRNTIQEIIDDFKDIDGFIIAIIRNPASY